MDSTTIERLLGQQRTSTILQNLLAMTGTLMIAGSLLQEAITSRGIPTRAVAEEAHRAIVIHVDLRETVTVPVLREIIERTHRVRAVRGRQSTMTIF